jgi:5'-methylthioadenosine phosphorylase
MGRLAVVLGSSALGPGGQQIAAAAADHGAAIVQRHGGGDAYVLPHRIDHEANLRPLAEQGVDRVLAISSVGSLKPEELPVGSLVCPDDFIALHLDHSIHADARAHTAPGFDRELRAEALAAWADGGQEPVDGGVYWQAVGPRFETPAEVRLIAAHADVVGMTVGSECVVAGELGLAYAALCMVDNLANGLGPAGLSVLELERDRAANAALLRDGLEAVLPRLGAVGR